MEIYCYSFSILICFMCSTLVYGGSSWIPLCQDTVIGSSNHTLLYNGGTSADSQVSSNSTFCFCTMESNHSFTLEVKRMKTTTQPLISNSRKYIFFTNGADENSSCERIDLVDVYNKPLDTDCLVSFSVNQSSPEYCWSNITDVSVFGFYHDLSSYMHIYLILKGDGIINTNCSSSDHPPAVFSSNPQCGTNNSSPTAIDNNNHTTTADTNSVQTASQNILTIKHGTSEPTTSQSYVTEMKQSKDNDFNIMNIGILLISIAAGFLLISLFLFVLTCRKRFSSKKKEAPPDDDDMEKASPEVSVTRYENTIVHKEISENKPSPTVVRNTSSLHDGAAKPVGDEPLNRRYTEGHVDMELQELERKPHYVAMKDLNQENVEVKQLLCDINESNKVQTEKDGDKNQNTDKVTYENELSHESMDKSQALSMSKDIKQMVKPDLKSASADQTSVERQVQKKHSVTAVCQDNRLDTVNEMDVHTPNRMSGSEVLNPSADNEEDIYENCSNNSLPGTPDCSDDTEPYVNISNHTDSNDKDSTKTPQVSSIQRSPDGPEKLSTTPLDTKAPGDKSSKKEGSESNSFMNGQDKTNQKLNDLKNPKSSALTPDSKFPSVPADTEEPDYDTISNSSEGLDESTNKWQNNEKPSDSLSGGETPLLRKESVKVVFLKPQPLTSSDEESLCSWLETEQKTSKLARLKQSKSADISLIQEPQVKPEKPKRSMSEDAFLKTSDEEFQNECEHLYEEVDDDLKESSKANAKSKITYNDMNLTPSDRTPVITKSTEKPEENKDFSVDVPHDNHDTEYNDLRNSDHMVDNDIYSLPDEALVGSALNNRNPHTYKTGSDKPNGSDRLSATKL